MNESDLINMLRTGRTIESALIERKPDNFKDREARKVVVAFANSTPDGQEAVLFVGIHDKTGEVLGVANPEELQRKYVRVLAECYPAIVFHIHALPVDGKTVLAIVVPASRRRPHFTGGAYIRTGSQSVLANAELYEELILSRTDKTRQLLELKHTHALVTVRGLNYRLGSQRIFSGGGHSEEIPDCKIEHCDAFRVRLYRLDSQTSFSEDLGRVTISFDDKKNRPMLLVVGPGRT